MLSRRQFLVRTGSVAALAVVMAPLASLGPVTSPVTGWAFVWHDWVEVPNQMVRTGYWSAYNEVRGIFNPVAVSELMLAPGLRQGEVVALLDSIKATAYDETVAFVRAYEARAEKPRSAHR